MVARPYMKVKKWSSIAIYTKGYNKHKIFTWVLVTLQINTCISLLLLLGNFLKHFRMFKHGKCCLMFKRFKNNCLFCTPTSIYKDKQTFCGYIIIWCSTQANQNVWRKQMEKDSWILTKLNVLGKQKGGNLKERNWTW